MSTQSKEQRFRDWFDLDRRLMLQGAAERRRPVVRAFRDPQRARIYDRHLALPNAKPGDTDYELRALDAYYYETHAVQWSLWGPDDQVIEAWGEGAAERGLVHERLVVMEKSTSAGALEPGVVLIEGPDRFERLEGLQVEISANQDLKLVVRELVDLLRDRARAGHEPVILAQEEAGELVSYMVFTVAGDRAWMEDLETRIECRGKGYARALLRSADAAAHALGVASLGFSADESDWPSKWYARLGFETMGHAVRWRRFM